MREWGQDSVPSPLPIDFPYGKPLHPTQMSYLWRKTGESELILAPNGRCQCVMVSLFNAGKGERAIKESREQCGRRGRMGIIHSPMRRSPIHHRVEETRNRHSRAVLQEETIIIRLARNLSREERREHIRSLLRRMMEQVLKEQRKRRISPFRHLLDRGESLTIRTATGKMYRFFLTPGPRTTVHTLKRTRGWTIAIGPTLRRPGLHRLLWSLLARAEQASLQELVHTINRRTLRVPLRTVTARFMRSQWGSCSASGTIVLNAALLFVPRRILHYVIIHELAHRRIHNHSARYWDVVKSALPHYRRAYRELQNYRLPSV